MVLHYKTMEHTYLCLPMVKAKDSKMTMCIGDVNCCYCKEKIKDYLDNFNHYSKPKNDNTKQLSLKDLI